MKLDGRGLITAVRTLSAIPVRGRDADRFSDALIWFPLVGVLLGGFLWAVGTAWSRVVSPAWADGGAVALVTAEIFLTRGLHLDGLGDWADALWGGRDRESRLRLMRDPRLGSFGVVALVTDLLAKWVVLKQLLLSESLCWIVPVFSISRAMMAMLMVDLSYARSGEGMARPFVEGSSRGQAVTVLVVSLCFSLLFGPGGVALFIAAWIMTKILGRTFKRGFGGITGDLLGTTNEVLEVTLLWLCAASGNVWFLWGGWGGQG